MLFRGGILILILVAFSSCISNKKHLAALDVVKVNHKAEVDQWEERLSTAKSDINHLQLQLAERKGENNILVENKKELKAQVESLESQIENMSSSSQTSQKSLNRKLVDKDQSIKALEQKLAELKKTLQQYSQSFDYLMSELRDSLRDFQNVSYQVEPGADEAVLVLGENLLFKNKSASRFTDDGYLALEKVSKVFQNHPEVSVIVVGHTDNTRPKNKSYKDNLNFSAMQTASVVRTLIEEYDMTPSQILMAAKGEFEPKTSNETLDGRLTNRRIEFRILPRTQKLKKLMEQKLRN